MDTSNSFGQSVDPVLFTNVACSGTEYKLLECGNTLGPTCSHTEDVVVICQDGKLFMFIFLNNWLVVV